jgi:hypothetical protein
MKVKWHIVFMVMFIVTLLVTCIEPYTPGVNNFESLLVVDALLTDEDLANRVVLSRTKMTAGEQAERVTGAEVIIRDDNGNSTLLKETAAGIYSTDSVTFRGVAGRAYTLYIKTSDGEEYSSDQCLMYQGKEMDSIFYRRDQQITDNEVHDGIRVYASSGGAGDCEYHRFTYDEWWKIRVPNPQEFNYINDSTFTEYVPRKEICWGHNKSNDIILKSQDAGTTLPVVFIDPVNSSRLLIQYCIDIRQLSISDREYSYWYQMSMINESGGDIFDKQPFQIKGNIHSITKPGETVLGYFQVSAATHLRKYITSDNADGLGLPNYEYPCKTFMVGPLDFTDSPEPMTFYKIYWMYINSGCLFVKPLYKLKGLWKLEFTTSICADCTLSGSLTKPAFWEDIK